MAMMFRGLGKPTDQLDISLAQPSNVLANPVGMSTPPIAPQQQAPQQTMRQQMYGDLPMWKILLGTALDNIAQQTGGAPAFSQGLQMQRQTNQRAQAAASQRQADWEDWVQKQVWQRDNPAPHYWETNDGSLARVGAGGQPEIVYQDPTKKMETIQVKDPATGEVKWYQVEQGGGGPSISPMPGAASNLPAIGSVIADPRKGGSGSGQNGFRP